MRICFISLISLVIIGCGGGPAPEPTAPIEPTATTPSTEPELTRVTEVFVTESKPDENVDSIGIHKGEETLAFVTGKGSHQLIVFDIADGSRKQTAGVLSGGTAMGDFMRPNGIQVIDDLVLVVERDNHRVQVLRAPGLEPLAAIGTDDLIRPYGLTCFAGDEGYELYVTDDYELEEGAEIPADYYTRRIKQFRFRVTGDEVEAERVAVFGDADGEGQLTKVESILADHEKNRLLIAVEQGPSPGIKVYDLEGRFTGESLDTSAFRGEPEGLALYITDKHQLLVTTDQRDLVTVFHLYDRASLAHLTSFRGEKTANTDGIAVLSEAVPGYPAGVLLAIHDDQALSAFSWADVIDALGL